jgi:putative transposase
MRAIRRTESNGPALIFLTAPTRDLMPIFSISELAQQAVLQLGRAAREANADVCGYTLLPSSLYTIVGFRGKYDLAGFVHNYKWLASRAIIALGHGEFEERLYRKGKFKPWMNRFDNLTLSSRKQFQSKLEKIHSEPVNKGFVINPVDWVYSSAAEWLMNRKGPIEIQKDINCFGLI